jgi:hypothetical protein
MSPNTKLTSSNKLTHNYREKLLCLYVDFRAEIHQVQFRQSRLKNQSLILFDARALPVANLTPSALILVSDINLRARRRRIKHVIFVLKEFSIYARCRCKRDLVRGFVSRFPFAVGIMNIRTSDPI